MKFISILTTTFFFMTNAFGASLKGTADALGSEARNIGLALGVFALVVAGIFLALGKQEGGQKVTSAVMGILVILTAGTLITTLRAVAGGA